MDATKHYDQAEKNMKELLHVRSAAQSIHAKLRRLLHKTGVIRYPSGITKCTKDGKEVEIRLV